MKTARLGSRGPHVEQWQDFLVAAGASSVTPDGRFGPITAAATQAWQHAQGLQPDGVVGPATWQAAGFSTVLAHPGPLVVDMAHYQDVHDLSAVANAAAFVALKASQGLSSVDETFIDRAIGLCNRTSPPIVGAYHFLTATDALEQAQHFLDVLSHVDRTGLVPILDVESAPDDELHDVTARRALEWTTHIEQALGRPVLVYTGSFFLHTFSSSAAGLALATRPLWIARYTNATDPDAVIPWALWLLWQYTSHGHVDGVANHCDLSRIAGGDVARLRAMLGL